MFELTPTSMEASAQLATLVPMNIDISPNDSGLPGISQLRTIVGAVMCRKRSGIRCKRCSMHTSLLLTRPKCTTTT